MQIRGWYSFAEWLGDVKGSLRGESPWERIGGTNEALGRLAVNTSEERKATPIWSGVLRYFPLAIAAVARVSKKGNDKHNPGEPMHWARGKSMDQEDCVIRHMMNPYETDKDTGELHVVLAAWRALAAAELALAALHDFRG